MKRLISFVCACLCLSQLVRAQTSAADDKAKRERDLKVPEIVKALDLKEGSLVADIGAGDGFYDVSLSKAVGATGRVYAEDIDEKGAIKHLRERVEKDKLGNVEVVLGVPDDPKLPAGALDGVLMVITYHEIADYKKMLEHVSEALKPGGRFVVVEMTPHKTLSRPRAVQMKNHVLAPDLAESEIREAGFEVASRDEHFIDNPDEEVVRWMIVFRKPVR
jgi:ubiquinone/menaquinone biosynthesis C-methylase UbiE